MQYLPWLVCPTPDCESICISHDVFSIDIHFHPYFLVAEAPVPYQSSKSDCMRRERSSVPIKRRTQPVGSSIELVDDRYVESLTEWLPHIWPHAVAPRNLDVVFALVRVRGPVEQVSTQLADILDVVCT